MMVVGKPHLMKKCNSDIIYSMIRERGPISKPALATATKLSLPTVNRLVDELVEQGYIDGENLVWNGSGCLFSLTGSAEEGFTAEKWASGLGIYIFSNCTAQQNADGTWSYTVGAEAIS